MCLTESIFKEQCVTLATKFCQLDDHWKLISQKCGRTKELKLDAINTQEISDEETLVLLVKDEARKVDSLEKICTFEYHVAFNQSYQVPVMYLCVSYQDGSPMEFENLITHVIDKANIDNPSQVISQVVHPIFFRPFYMIHPCRTKDFMELHSNLNIENYLISWLSIVANLINLRLNHELFSN